jgi:hypothetical protein
MYYVKIYALAAGAASQAYVREVSDHPAIVRLPKRFSEGEKVNG